MRLLIFILIFTKSAFGMYGYTVPHAEKLFISQKCIMSCWAATSEGIYNYINQNSKKYQDDIVMNNPKAFNNNFCIPQVINYDFFIGASDYLLDTVLSNDNYVGEIKFFPDYDELEFIKKELHKNKPMIVFFDFHARIIFGYFKIGEDTFLQMYNPAVSFASPYENFHPIETLNYENFIFRKILGQDTNSVNLVYLKERYNEK